MSHTEDIDCSASDQTSSEKLLFYSRTGDYAKVKELFNQFNKGQAKINVNCKGNHDWTPLHLACYFGNEKIVQFLLANGADVNVVNDTGDTPLHKASYTGREELVLDLLSRNADVFIKNSEGLTPMCVSNNEEIKKLLTAAGTADAERKNSSLLQAAREGDIDIIEDLLKRNHPPDINCVDSLGNSALHCASYRGKKEVAVLLLQNGINTHIKNLRGQLAIDLAMNVATKQILGVQPVKHFQKNAAGLEGMLLRKSRFLGWREVWTILEKGVMSFFNSRADSTTGTRRKGYKYLDGAKVLIDNTDVAAFTVVYSDNTRQRFSVSCSNQQVDRQKWVNAVNEHIEFSSHYLKQRFSDSDSDPDDDIIPVGTLQDKLQIAQAHLQLLEKNIDCMKESLEESCRENSHSVFYTEIPADRLNSQVDSLIDSARKATNSLSHCYAVFAQQEELRILQQKQQEERCRFLQDALHTLAQEHHDLEKSFTGPFYSQHLYQDTECDEFFDAFEGDHIETRNLNKGDSDSEHDSISTTGHFASFSHSSSETMKTTVPSKWGRITLPVPQFSRNDFSIWSILKQCIGKELSKITMPVVFNEPLSFLQRLSENVEYANLLNKANNSEDPVKRMEFVAAFAVACISSNWERLGKPFNPLLGETFEFLREEEGFQMVSEQVSHHPPVTAFHIESPGYTFSGAIHPKLKLWARSVEVKPEGTVILKLLKHNETYTWTGVTCCVHNIIVGKLWMEQCGRMEITCQTSGLVAVLDFKPAGWYGKDLNCVEGFILNTKKTRLSFIFGKWCSILWKLDMSHYEEYLKIKELSTSNARTSTLNKESSNFLSLIEKHIENQDEKSKAMNCLDEFTLLWEADPRPEWSSEYYNFTYFAMGLNEMVGDVKNRLPQTDSRHRPDIRRLEEGDVDGAAFEKNRLEEKQREVRKLRKKDKTTWVPLWFESKPHPFAKEEFWSYKGGYWDRNFSNCPDIF